MDSRPNYAYTAPVVFSRKHFGYVSRVLLLTAACISVVIGIGLVMAGLRLGVWWLIVAAVASLLCARRRVVIAVPAAVVVGLVLGAVCGTHQANQLAHYPAYYGQKVVVTGVVSEDPTYDNQQKVMYIEHVAVNGNALPGKVRVKSIAPVDPRRGDKVEVKGKLLDGFGNYQAAIYFADLRVTEVANSPIDALRREFAARIYSLLPDAQAGLGLGFLVGLRSALPDTLDSELKILGLTHIVVASGYNLTVLVRLARRVFAKSSHYQMTVASAGLVGCFVLVTGFSPSMSRAGLVAGLSILAWYYGRRMHPALLISLVAAGTGMVNPLYVWGDLGWWLSFLAFGGVMLLAPLLQRRIFGEREPKLIGQVMLETVCAQLTTLPLIIFIFGNLAVLSVVSNLLVVPLIPVAMLCTFVAGAIGPFFAYAAWPAIWLLGFICQLVHLLAQVSWASINFKIGLPVFIGCNAALVAVYALLLRKTKHDYLGKSVIE